MLVYYLKTSKHLDAAAAAVVAMHFGQRELRVCSARQCNLYFTLACTRTLTHTRARWLSDPEPVY